MREALVVWSVFSVMLFPAALVRGRSAWWAWIVMLPGAVAWAPFVAALWAWDVLRCVARKAE